MLVKKIHPYIYIIMTFVIVILVGTLVLMLPISSSDGKSFGFVNSLFMATSAVCVTGLSVMNLAMDMSIFGRVVMTILMEIGGLSFITIAVFFFTIIGAKIGVSNRFLLREALNQNSVSGIVSLVKKIMLISFSIQFICALINLISLMDYYNNNFWYAFGASIFHSASSFNNAGFDIFGSESLIPFKDNILINSTTMVLIFFGGIGFIVIDEIIKKRRWRKFNLHTKLTLITTFILLIIGGLAIKLTYPELSLLQSFFTSFASRTCGSTTFDMAGLKNHPACYIIIILLMLIGASPCSTGGGIKTTTIAIAVLAIISYAKGKKTTVFHRKIQESQIFKSFVLIVMFSFIIFIGTFIICSIQPELGIQEIFFEVVSAFSTTGFSMGITSSLNTTSRIIISILMLLGRIGPLTIIGVVNKNWMTASNDDIQYVEESVIVG